MQGTNGQPPPPQQHQQPQQVARLPQPITAKHKDSRTAGRRDNQKRRHRQGTNNFVAITPAALERENSGAAFFALPLVGRLCQTPILSIRHRQNLFDMAIISSAWPNCSNRILSNVIPFFVD